MKKYIDHALNDYEKSCQELAKMFRDKYFAKSIEVDFVSGDVTGIAEIADLYFTIDTMYQYLKYKYTKEQMFKRYDAELENAMLKKPLPFTCIRDWKQIEKFANKNKLK
jgi:hypothetical protein